MSSFICSPASTDDIKKRLKLNKEASIAGAFAGTGVPILDSIIEDLATSLSSLASAGMAAAVSAAQAKVKESIESILGPFASSAVLNIVAIVNLEAEAQSVGQGVIAGNLRQQVYLRYALNRELLFHIQGLLNILQRLNRQNELKQDVRLRRAYPYIKEAHSQMTKVRGMLLSGKPRFNKQLYKNSLLNIDQAINTLTGARSRDLAKRFLEADRTNKLKSFGNLIFEDVVSQYVMLAEAYMWHLSNLAAISAGGYTPTGFGLTSLTRNRDIPGVPTNRNQELITRQSNLNALKRQLVDATPPIDPAFKTLAWINVNKGLILTHEAAKTSATLLLSFPAEWSKLTKASKTLWTAASPGYGILTSVKEQVETALGRDPQKVDVLTRDIIEPMLLITWVTGGLESAKQALLGIEGASNQFDAVEEDMAVWDDLTTYLLSTDYTAGIESLDKVLKLLITISAFALTGPLNRRILQRAVVLFREMELLVNKSINQDAILLQKLQNFNIMNNPGVAATAKLITDIAAQSPASAAMVSSLVNGGIGNVTSMIAGIGTSLSGGISVLSDSYKKLFSECEQTNTKTAFINQKIEEATLVQEDRDLKDIKAKEALSKVTQTSWYDKLGDTGSEFMIDLGL